MKNKRKVICILTVLVMLFSLCGCGAQAPNGEEKKSDFIVEINGKEYDFAGDYMTLLKEFMDDEILVVDYRLMEYNRDGSVDEKNGMNYLADPKFIENPFYMSMYENLTIYDMIVNEYRFPIDGEGVVFQSSLQGIQNVENRDSIENYWLMENEIIGIYADGELIDIDPYIELVKKEKEENNVLRGISQKYVYDYEELAWAYTGANTRINKYYHENKEELTERMLLSLGPGMHSKDITISEVSELIPDFENYLAVSIACQETLRKLAKDEIEWCGMIRVDSSNDIFFSYYDNDEKEKNAKIERNGFVVQPK